eukprot:4638058-Prymnesium_polylepis.1
MEGRNARRRKSRWGLGPSAGPEDKWLDEKARLYESTEFREQFRLSMAGRFEIQHSDNAAFYKAAA